jgi:hypothetical protein
VFIFWKGAGGGVSVISLLKVGGASFNKDETHDTNIKGVDITIRVATSCFFMMFFDYALS